MKCELFLNDTAERNNKTRWVWSERRSTSGPEDRSSGSRLASPNNDEKHCFTGHSRIQCEALLVPLLLVRVTAATRLVPGQVPLALVHERKSKAEVLGDIGLDLSFHGLTAKAVVRSSWDWRPVSEFFVCGLEKPSGNRAWIFQQIHLRLSGNPGTEPLRARKYCVV